MNQNFVEQLMQSVGPEVVSQLGSSLNIPSGAAEGLLPKIAPLILGGLKRQSENHGGEARVNHILDKYGKEDALDDIAGIFRQRSADPNPDPGLGGLLGAAGPQAADLLEKQFGLSAGLGSKLIPMLAPIILGALTKQRRLGGAGGPGVQHQNPIMGILDQDGDGSVLDDVAGMLFNQAAGGHGSQGGGILGKILGSVLGGGRR